MALETRVSHWLFGARPPYYIYTYSRSYISRYPNFILFYIKDSTSRVWPAGDWRRTDEVSVWNFPNSLRHFFVTHKHFGQIKLVVPVLIIVTWLALALLCEHSVPSLLKYNHNHCSKQIRRIK